MKKLKRLHKKQLLLVLLGIIAFCLLGYWLMGTMNSNITVNQIPTYAEDFGDVTSHETKNFCSYAATNNSKYCSNITIVEVIYDTYKSPLSANHGWREVSSPFDVFVRNDQGQLVCAIRKEQHSGQAKQITFFTRPETAGDNSCTKV